MSKLKLFVLISFIVILMAACDTEAPGGGGTLPESGQELVAQYISSARGDETGGRIVYIKEINAAPEGGTLWCVNVRYLNRNGVRTVPVIVSKQGSTWDLVEDPASASYDSFGCAWPETSG